MPEFDATIEYRDVPGFAGYKVGNDGSLWSCCRPKGAWKRLKDRLTNTGRMQAVLYKKGMRNGFRMQLHRLVLSVFIGEPPNSMVEGCHNDGNPTNNHVRNLRWDTKIGNLADRVKHGTLCRGAKNPNVRLTEDDVIEITARLRDGDTMADIAKSFGVNSRTIFNINHGITWAWLTGASKPLPISPMKRGAKPVRSGYRATYELLKVRNEAIIQESQSDIRS